MADANSRTCTKCGIEKPLDQFAKSKQRKCGRSSHCKACVCAMTRQYMADRGSEYKLRKKEYDIERNAKLRDEISAKAKLRYEKNRAHRLAASKTWTLNNPEKTQAIKQAYKHRRRTQEKRGMSGTELAAWKRAQPKVCYWCGCKCAKGFVVDHYQPLAKGGKHEADNLVIACRPCNARKSAKDPIEFAQSLGFLL